MTHVFSGGPVRMFRLTNEPGGLGLSCTRDGVALAGVPLLRKTQKGFEPRPAMEIASLLRAAPTRRSIFLTFRRRKRWSFPQQMIPIRLGARCASP